MPRKAKTSTRKTPQPKSERVVTRVIVRGKYDAAQTTDDNKRHWANADSFSANAALMPEVRRKLRDRARYEIANNSWGKGIGLTIANDTVGTGPSLQVLGYDEGKEEIETAFYEWAESIRLADKLRLMRFARYDSGECFAQLLNNPGVGNEVELDVVVIEADQIANPFGLPVRGGTDVYPTERDGIIYDQYANPVAYRKLRAHPGGLDFMAFATQYDDVPASQVFHYYRPDRPGQSRGIPDVTPAIPLFAELRRYTAAVIASAETAAEHAGVMETDAPADGDAADAQTGDNPQSWDLVNLEKRGLLVLPYGFKLSQLKAEQPTETHTSFVATKMREIARCLCVPAHIALLDPEIANMSSSYVVGQMYTYERKVDRSCLEYMLNWLFLAWLREARLVSGYLPVLPPQLAFQWFWPSLQHHADPLKVASAAATELANGLTTLPLFYSAQGMDCTEQLTLGASAMGVSLEQYQELIRNKVFGAGISAPNGQIPQDPTGDSNAQTSNGNGYRRSVTRPR